MSPLTRKLGCHTRIFCIVMSLVLASCAKGQLGIVNTESPATGPAGVTGSGGTGAAGSVGSGGTMGGTTAEAAHETAGAGAGTTAQPRQPPSR